MCNGLRDPGGGLTKKNIDLFKIHYGSDPTSLSYLWYDIVTTSKEITAKDVSDNGFKRFLMAHHFLWGYPKNRHILAEAFGLHVRQVEGDNLWRWVRMIASMKATKIVWPDT